MGQDDGTEQDRRRELRKSAQVRTKREPPLRVTSELLVLEPKIAQIVGRAAVSSALSRMSFFHVLLVSLEGLIRGRFWKES